MAAVTPPILSELIAQFEKESGLKIAQLKRCRRGAQSFNYAGIFDDGRRFALKLISENKPNQYARLIDHLECVRLGPIVQEFKPSVRFQISGFRAITFSWCEGEILSISKVYDMDGLSKLLSAYHEFSANICKVTKLSYTYDYPAMLRKVKSSKLAGLVAGITSDEFDVLDRKTIIHGDFQADNLRFNNGQLTAVLDIQEFRFGDVVEDFARYVCCSIGHIPWGRFLTRHYEYLASVHLAMASNFGFARWRAAVDGHLLEKLERAVRKGSISLNKRVSLKFAAYMHHKLVKKLAEKMLEK